VKLTASKAGYLTGKQRKIDSMSCAPKPIIIALQLRHSQLGLLICYTTKLIMYCPIVKFTHRNTGHGCIIFSRTQIAIFIGNRTTIRKLTLMLTSFCDQ